MSFNLPESLYSVDQLSLCSDELRQYAEVLRQAQNQKKVGSAQVKIVLPDLSAASYDLIEALPKSRRLDVEVIDGVCDILDNWLVAAPVVNITLPAPATRSLKTELVSWFRNNVGQQIVLSFHVNPDIAGGMVVRTTNQVHDFSFRKQLLASPEKIVTVIERV